MSEIVRFEAEGVCGFLHHPKGAAEDGLVLTHGAGGNCETPLLQKLAAAFCAAGFLVLRCDLPFRQRRPRGPPSRSNAAADRAGLRAALAELRGRVAGPVFLGGHSYGGRQASMLAAEEPQSVAGLLLLSYPLHPPGKPSQPRTEHFPRLALPVVFVHGTGDPFGTVEELRGAAAAIPGPTQVIAVVGAGHDLKRGGFETTPLITALGAVKSA